MLQISDVCTFYIAIQMIRGTLRAAIHNVGVAVVVMSEVVMKYRVMKDNSSFPIISLVR